MQPTAQETPKFIPVWAVAAILKRSHRTIRNWAADGRVPSMKDPKTGMLLIDGAAATIEHERTPTRKRITGVSDCVVKSSKSSSQLAPVSLDPGASSCLEGFSVAEPPAETRVVRLLMRPELDPEAVEAFKTQLDELAAHTTWRLAQAVTAGLSVEGLTVHMNGTTET